MNNDARLMFENYLNKLEETKVATPSHGTPIYNRPTSAPGTRPGYDAIQNTINKKLSQKPGSTPKRDEDAESTEHCSYAQKGCDCNECEECKANQSKSEDAETYGVEDKIKMALHEIEGIGYTGDHIDPKEVAKLVVGSPNDWGDSYGHVLQALEHVIEAFYEKGLQDS